MEQLEQRVSEMTSRQRIRLVDVITVYYPLFEEILEVIKDYHHDNKEVEPDCLFIQGLTGSGKSTLKQVYLDDYPRLFTDEGTVVPVLSSTIPAKATINGTASKLLKSLGDPAYDKGSVDNKTLRLAKLVHDCQVELIFLDELNHLIDRESERLLKLIADWLKELIIETNVPVVAFGLPEAKGVLSPDVNKQLSRRFAQRLTLKPFGWLEDDGIAFRTFLHLVESKIPLIEESNLSEETMAKRFFYATDGSVAHIMLLARHGTRLALKKKQEVLSLDILAAVFETHIWADKPSKENNPFLTMDFEIMEISETISSKTIESTDASFNNFKATNNRIQAQKQQLKASDVLR